MQDRHSVKLTDGLPRGCLLYFSGLVSGFIDDLPQSGNRYFFVIVLDPRFRLRIADLCVYDTIGFF